MNDDDHYNRLIEAAHQRIDRLERLARNSNNAPTIPSYDQFNFPQDAVYGQIAKDYNDHTLWVYGEDDDWHQVGGGRIGAAARISATYTPGGGPDPLLTFTAGTTTVVPFYRVASTNSDAIAFSNSIGTGVPDNTIPAKSIYCNPGFNNGGIYTINCGLHIASGGGPNIDLIINNSDELTPEGWMDTRNQGYFQPTWGQVGNIARSQLFCASTSSQGLYVYVYNNNAFDVFPGWIALSIDYIPTLDANILGNPLAINNHGGSEI